VPIVHIVGLLFAVMMTLLFWVVVIWLLLRLS